MQQEMEHSQEYSLQATEEQAMPSALFEMVEESQQVQGDGELDGADPKDYWQEEDEHVSIPQLPILYDGMYLHVKKIIHLILRLQTFQSFQRVGKTEFQKHTAV